MRKKVVYALLFGPIAIVSSLYLYGHFIPDVKLYATLVCQSMIPSNNSPELSKCHDPEAISVNDELLAQSPKLNNALVSALHLPPDGPSGVRTYMVDMSRSEFDGMNQVLINTEQGQERAKHTVLPIFSPTQILWINSGTVVKLEYNGNSYGLVAKSDWLYLFPLP